jgi:hypothetical protein
MQVCISKLIDLLLPPLLFSHHHFFSKVRLTGGDANMGKVEVNINGRWGVICGDRWTMRNSMIVCKQLGLGYAARNWSSRHFGTGKILLSGITCLGHETSLDECLRHYNVNCSQTKRLAALRCAKGKCLVI